MTLDALEKVLYRIGDPSSAEQERFTAWGIAMTQLRQLRPVVEVPAGTKLWAIGSTMRVVHAKDVIRVPAQSLTQATSLLGGFLCFRLRSGAFAVPVRHVRLVPR